VEDFAIYHIKRRVFQGEEAIRIVERVLKIDASRDPVYQFGGRKNFSGQDYSGYSNARGVAPGVGQRRSYNDYSRGQQDQQSYGGGYKRQNQSYDRPRQQPNYSNDGRPLQN